MPNPRAEFFKGAISYQYHSELRRKHLLPFLEHLDAQGKLGEVIVDAGSAGLLEDSGSLEAKQIDRNYIPTNGKKVIRWDLGFSKPVEKVTEGMLNVQGDLEADPKSFNARRRLVAIKNFLGKRTNADTVVMADVLNYVDYKKALSNVHSFLRKDGRVVIVSSPGIGCGALFSASAPRSNQLIIKALKAIGFEIEHSASESQAKEDYPNRSTIPPSNNALIVARKI